MSETYFKGCHFFSFLFQREIFQMHEKIEILIELSRVYEVFGIFLLLAKSEIEFLPIALHRK